MTRLKIALMAGGDSPEREIALQSAAQMSKIYDQVITRAVNDIGRLQ